MGKKRKYKRKKIKNNFLQIKYIILFFIFSFIIHFLHINISPYFENVRSKDVLIVYTHHTIQSGKLDKKDQKFLSKNISYFGFTQPRKILVLGENSHQGNQTEIITDFLLNNDIWGGNIAQENAKKSNYGIVTNNFLQKQNLDDALIMSNLGNYYKNKKYFQTNKYSNISIKLYYENISDIFLGSIKNYYYFWKK